MRKSEGRKMLPGVYVDKLKNGQPNYRSGLTISNKHISLGSYETMEKASKAYKEALEVMNSKVTINEYSENYSLSFDKYVMLINYRDTKFYASAPIYIRKRDFSYYLSPSIELKFDMDDLFYFSNKKIMQRGNRLFVSDYGMQVSLKERFGIMSFAVAGRDYKFVNDDPYDYRRENIEIINRFHGVRKITKKMKTVYKVVIHPSSDFVVGIYSSEKEAAIAYNKAADVLNKNGFNKDFLLNFVDNCSNKEYADIYDKLAISQKIIALKPSL